MSHKSVFDRRRLVLGGLAFPVLVLAEPALAGPVVRALASGGRLEATPPCGDPDETPEQTEGPYYTPRSPRRRSLLEPGMAGTRLVLTGTVITTGCRPVKGALLDFWQADAAGVYDNDGFRLRGHQLAEARGRYRLETVVPGLYPGRTRHIHAKVKVPGRPVLTTQIYFPGVRANASDGIFDSRLLVRGLRRRPGLWTARFDVVV
jgi:protocatechuate 3,4-dioxygenase beta subunit